MHCRPRRRQREQLPISRSAESHLIFNLRQLEQAFPFRDNGTAETVSDGLVRFCFLVGGPETSIVGGAGGSLKPVLFMMETLGRVLLTAHTSMMESDKTRKEWRH